MSSKKNRYVKDIYTCSFTTLDRVTLCLDKESYLDECKEYDYDAYLETDGICTRLKKEGRRGCCIIGINDALTMDKIQLVGILAHEITHAVDFIMDDQGFKDMELRAYMVHDMIMKAMIFIKKLKKKLNNCNTAIEESRRMKMKNRGRYPYFESSGLRLKIVDDCEELADSSKETLLKYIKEEAIPCLRNTIFDKRKESSSIINEIERYRDNGYMEKIMKDKIYKLFKKLEEQDKNIARLEERLKDLKEADRLNTYDQFLELHCFRC